jgi:hypothetical protein
MEESEEAYIEVLCHNLPDVTEEEQDKNTIISVSRLTVNTVTHQNYFP